MACPKTLKVRINGFYTDPLTYLWSDGSTSPTLQVTQNGTYSVTVTDANGCTETQTYEVDCDE